MKDLKDLKEMMPKQLPDALVKAKDEIKAECMPMGHSILYVLCCLVWICMLPMMLLGKLFKDLAMKFKPEKKEPKLEEPKLEEPVA